MIKPVGNVNFGKVTITHRSNKEQEHKIIFKQEEVFKDENGTYIITQTWEPKDANNLDIQG